MRDRLRRRVTRSVRPAEFFDDNGRFRVAICGHPRLCDEDVSNDRDRAADERAEPVGFQRFCRDAAPVDFAADDVGDVAPGWWLRRPARACLLIAHIPLQQLSFSMTSLTLCGMIRRMPTTARSLGVLMLIAAAAHAEAPRSATIEVLTKKIAEHERGAEEVFWRQLAAAGTPLVEAGDAPGRSLVTFVWRAAPGTRRVQLFGPFLPPQPEAELMRVPGSSTFFVSLPFPDDARFTYSLIIDGDGTPKFQPGHFHHDPFNKHQYDVTQSIVELPRSPAQPSLVAHAATPAGTLWRHKVRGPSPQQERSVFVYTPAGYSPTATPYPLFIAFDGESATFEIPTALVLDELIAAKRIPPVVALFIGTANRGQDLAPNESFADFVALDLVPWMRARYHATSSPRQTVVSGISLGGVAAVYAAFRHPEVYGNVLEQSGAFWWPPDGAEPEQAAREAATAPPLPLRFWMEVGTLELAQPRRDTTQLASNRHLRDVLRARGYDVSYHEFTGGHSYVSWRGTLADGLVALFGNPSRLPVPSTPKRATRPPLDVTAGERLAFPLLVRAALVSGAEAGVTAAKRLLAANADGYVLDENEINTAGCLLMTIDHPRESLGLLRWNTERFPMSANTWDSLAWAYYFAGDKVRAVESLKQDLRLDPKNAHAAQLLGELTAPLP
jgi:enterochelin esterase-like enzyme